MNLYWILPIHVPFLSSGKVNLWCNTNFTGLYLWNVGAERLGLFIQIYKTCLWQNGHINSSLFAPWSLVFISSKLSL